MNTKTICIVVAMGALIYMTSTASAAASSDRQAKSISFTKVIDQLYSYFNEDLKRQARSTLTSLGLNGPDVLKVHFFI
jgi:hypothetical protein